MAVNTRIQIRISPRLEAAIQKEADRKGMSPAEFVRWILSAGLGLSEKYRKRVKRARGRM